MAHPFLHRLTLRLDAQRAAGLDRTVMTPETRTTRHVILDGQRLCNFASNDYLGLADDAAWRAEVADCFARHPASGTASRLAAGHSALVAEAEAAWAEHFGYESCLFLPSGYQANLAVVTGLLHTGDTLFIDRRIHASMARAVPLCGAHPVTYPHGDLARLDRRLTAWRHETTAETASAAPLTEGAPLSSPPATCPTASPPPHGDASPVILTESLFSMDGTMTSMGALATLRSRHGAFVILDEAHACGALGQGGRGLAWGQTENAPAADVIVGTLGKGPGFFGAFVLMPRIVRESLENFASAVMHSTALPEAHAAAVLRLLPRMAGMDDARARLARNARALREGLAGCGLPVHGDAHILCIETGDEAQATQLARRLRSQGVLALPARHPTVPQGHAIVRFSVTAAHTDDDITYCKETVHTCLHTR